MAVMKGTHALSVDYTGPHGGQLAMAFAAGCLAASAFWGGLGKFLWSILGKTKDDRIAELISTIEANEARCAETNAALTMRALCPQ